MVRIASKIIISLCMSKSVLHSLDWSFKVPSKTSLSVLFIHFFLFPFLSNKIKINLNNAPSGRFYSFSLSLFLQRRLIILMTSQNGNTVTKFLWRHQIRKVILERNLNIQISITHTVCFFPQKSFETKFKGWITYKTLRRKTPIYLC